jgi:hypothetical protein
MSDEPEDDSVWERIAETKTFSFILMAPPMVGVFLIIQGLGGWGWFPMVVGGLLLIATPFIARWVWRGGLWE